MNKICETIEIWKPVDSFPDYEVSSLGRIRRIKESQKGHLPKILSPWVNNKGYSMIILFSDGKPRRRLVSRLVCEAFNGPSKNGREQAAHNDGVPSNNFAKNLRWATRSENMADCLAHGTRAMGERHGRTTKPEKTPRGAQHGHAKLSDRDVIKIRAEPKIFGSGVKLARQYGVSPALISLIRAGKNWRHI